MGGVGGIFWQHKDSLLKKKKASGARIQNFSLNLMKYHAGLHFGEAFRNLSVACLTLHKLFPFIPASHLSALVQGKEQCLAASFRVISPELPLD